MPPHLLDGALPLEGSWQHDDRELRLVPPAPPVRRPGDPVGGRWGLLNRKWKPVLLSKLIERRTRILMIVLRV